MSTHNQNGIGFLGALTLVLIVLKLIGAISLSWWLVLGPLWIPAATFLIVASIAALVFALMTIVPDAIKHYKWRRAQRKK